MSQAVLGTHVKCTHSLVSFWVEYANSLLFGTKQKNISQLQRIQIFYTRHGCCWSCSPSRHYSSATLQCLHWLPVNQRIKFKLAAVTHSTLGSSQPAYLHSLLSYHIPARSLCSSNTNLLLLPSAHTSFASYSFSITASQSGTHRLLVFSLVGHHTTASS